MSDKNLSISEQKKATPEQEIATPVYFKRRETHFYKKSSIVPNHLFFDPKITDPALRLLLALNAVPDSWVVHRTDIMKRLEWGKDKIKGAVDCLENLGYLKVTQSKDESGRFLPNTYEYDVHPVYLANSSLENELTPSHNEYEPEAGDPSPEDPSAGDPPPVDPHISLFSEKSMFIEEQQQQMKAGDPSVVVVFSEEQKKILRLLDSVDSSKEIQEIAIKFSFEHVQKAVEAFKQRLASGTLVNPTGFLRISIEKGWKPNEVKSQDTDDKKDELEELHKNKKLASSLIIDFHKVKSNYPGKLIHLDAFGIIFEDYNKNIRNKVLFNDSNFEDKLIEAREKFKKW